MALYEVANPITKDETEMIYSYSDDVVTAATSMISIAKRYCDATLSNKTLMQSLRDVDIIVGNAIYVCSILIPEVLQKPFIIIEYGDDIFGYYTFYGKYRPASHIGNFLMFHSPKLTFWQRFGNLVVKTFLEKMERHFCINAADDLRYQHNISIHSSLDELRSKM